MAKAPFCGITADVHLHNFSAYSRIDENGVNSRLKRICEALDWCMTQTEKSGAADFIVAGDLFHVRREVPTMVLDMATDVLGSHPKLKIHLLVGNHDLNSSSDHTSVAALKGIANIVRKPKPVTMSDGTVVGFIPWTDDQATVQTTFNALRKKGCQHFVGHLGIDGSKLGPSNIEIPGHIKLDGVVPKDVQWVVLGHYHKPQVVHELPHIRYVGSPLQHNRGERNEDKGFVLGYTDSLKFVPNTFSPRFIDVEDGTDLSDVKPHDYVRIVTTTKEAAATITKSVKAAVGDQDTDAVVEIRSNVEIKQRLKLTGLENKKMLSKYITHVPPPEGVNPDSLRDVGLTILSGSLS